MPAFRPIARFFIPAFRLIARFLIPAFRPIARFLIRAFRPIARFLIPAFRPIARFLIPAFRPIARFSHQYFVLSLDFSQLFHPLARFLIPAFRPIARFLIADRKFSYHPRRIVLMKQSYRVRVAEQDDPKRGEQRTAGKRLSPSSRSMTCITPIQPPSFAHISSHIRKSIFRTVLPSCHLRGPSRKKSRQTKYFHSLLRHYAL